MDVDREVGLFLQCLGGKPAFGPSGFGGAAIIIILIPMLNTRHKLCLGVIVDSENPTTVYFADDLPLGPLSCACAGSTAMILAHLSHFGPVPLRSFLSKGAVCRVFLKRLDVANRRLERGHLFDQCSKMATFICGCVRQTEIVFQVHFQMR